MGVYGDSLVFPHWLHFSDQPLGIWSLIKVLDKLNFWPDDGGRKKKFSSLFSLIRLVAEHRSTMTVHITVELIRGAWMSVHGNPSAGEKFHSTNWRKRSPVGYILWGPWMSVHGNKSNSCWAIFVWTKVVDQLTVRTTSPFMASSLKKKRGENKQRGWLDEGEAKQITRVNRKTGFLLL